MGGFCFKSRRQTESPIDDLAEAKDTGERETATIGGGCFWCIDSCYRHIEGVKSVESGYAGGHVKNPSYRDICTGQSGHAEVVRI